MRNSSKSVAIILFSLQVCVQAANIDFTSSGTITAGDVYDWVHVKNAGTVVDMTGGQVNIVDGSGSSTFNMSGGQIATVTLTSGSTFNLYSGGTITSYISVNNLCTMNVFGGTINTDLHIYVGAGGTFNISGGNMTTSHFKIDPGASSQKIINITGGTLNFQAFDISGVVNISGGIINIQDIIAGTGMMNISGHGFNYNTSTEVLTGYLLDNHYFTMNNVSADDYAHINLIPEPISILLLGLGSLGLRRKK